MVNPALRSEIESMSVDERLELVEFIEATVDRSDPQLTDKQKAAIRARADELDADPSIGLSWDELASSIGARRG
jgi:putative addiction module component (TIGR02574 family)